MVSNSASSSLLLLTCDLRVGACQKVRPRSGQDSFWSHHPSDRGY
jgi:hypothetical protein